MKIKKFILYGLACLGLLFIFLTGAGAAGTLFSSALPGGRGGYYSLLSGESGKSLSYPQTPSLTPLSDVPSSGNREQAEGLGETVEEEDSAQRKVVKNGSLSLLVKKAEETAGRIRNVALELDGFVSYSQVQEVTEGVKRGTVTIKIPADKFSEAMERIKELALDVENEEERTRDVTEEFTDLEARLKNLKAEEEQYLRLLEEAEDMEDILKVTSHLSNVRGRIERMEGRLKYLSNQVEMATIRVSLTSEAEVEVLGVRWRPLFMVKKSFKGMLSGLSNYANFVIKFIFALPVLILWVGSLGLFAFIAVKILIWFVKKLKR